MNEIEQAQEEVEILKALKKAKDHIRTDKYLFEDTEIIKACKDIEGALFEREEMANDKTEDHALDNAIGFEGIPF